MLNLEGYAQGDTSIDWKSDIEYIKTNLPAKHKKLFFRYSKEEFNNSLDQLSIQCKELTDLQVAIKLQQIVVKIGDAHTGSDYYQFLDKTKLLPFSLFWFSDGMKILKTSKQNKDILGGELKKINGFPIEVIIDSLCTLIVEDNEACKKMSIPSLILYIQLLQYFGFVNESMPMLEIESMSGERKVFQLIQDLISDSSVVEIKPEVKPFYRSSSQLYFNEKYFAEDSIYFLQYNKCWSKELEEGYGNIERAKGLPSFIAFEQKVFQTLREKPIKKLVFDMRFNSGGSSLQGTDFIKQLAGYEFLNKRKMIYVVIGRRTFSSAILNVLDFKRYTKAITIGEETSGSPNHFGEIKNLKLPSSQMDVYYSTKYFKMTNKKETTIEPDFKCPVSFSDYKNGLDPAYEYVRNH